MKAALEYGVGLGIAVDHSEYSAEVPRLPSETRAALVADLA